MTYVRQPVISTELATRIADFLSANGIGSPYESDYDAPKKPDGSFARAHERLDMAQFGTLPQFWDLDVSDVLAKRRAAKWRADRRAAIESFETTPAIKAMLLGLEAKDERGLCAPEIHDLSESLRYAVDPSRGPRRSLYAPKAGCKAKLKAKLAVRYSYTQESYADHSRIAIPVEIEAGADREVCRTNLARLAEGMRTHNGYAGSGSTYTLTLVETDLGAYVDIDARHSIAD